MKKSVLAAGGVFLATFGVLVGVNLTSTSSPKYSDPPIQYNIVTVADPTEAPSPTPAVAPSPSTMRPSLVRVAPRTNAPDPENPEAGGNTGGGFATPRPQPTGTNPAN